MDRNFLLGNEHGVTGISGLRRDGMAVLMNSVKHRIFLVSVFRGQNGTWDSGIGEWEFSYDWDDDWMGWIGSGWTWTTLPVLRWQGNFACVEGEGGYLMIL